MERMITQERQQKTVSFNNNTQVDQTRAQTPKKKKITILENVVLNTTSEKETCEDSNINFIAFKTKKIRDEQNKAKQNIEAKRDQLEKIKQSVKEAAANVALVQNEVIEKNAKLELKKHYGNADKKTLTEIRNKCERNYGFCQTISEDLQNWGDCMNRLEKNKEEYLKVLTGHLDDKENELDKREEYAMKSEKIETVKKKHDEVKKMIEVEKEPIFDREIHTLKEELQAKTDLRTKLLEEIEEMKNDFKLKNQTKNDILEKVKLVGEVKIKYEKEIFWKNQQLNETSNEQTDESNLNEMIQQIEEAISANAEKNETLLKEIEEAKLQLSEVSEKIEASSKARQDLEKEFDELKISALETQIEESKNDIKQKNEVYVEQLREIELQFQKADENFRPQMEKLSEEVENLKKERDPIVRRAEELILKTTKNISEKSELLIKNQEKESQRCELTDKCANLVNKIRELEKTKDELMAAAKNTEKKSEPKFVYPQKRPSATRSELDFSDSSSELGFLVNKKKLKTARRTF